jgi:hypothetical protein
MPGRDPDHWLYRLTSDEWLRAAEHELVRATSSFQSRQQRGGVAGARRAAGMAWNAVLAETDPPDAAYGRSYMDHLQALAADPTVPEAVRLAAKVLVEAPLTQQLLALGRPDLHVADAARTVVAHARDRVRPPGSA